MNDKLKCEKECSGCSSGRFPQEPENGVCCVDTYRIFDSCRSQDCVEGARIYFTDATQQLINSSVSLRTKSVRVLWTQITTDETPFNAGYYQVNIRYYFYVLLDSCQGQGNTREVQGLAIFDKTVMLFGGQGNVSSFQSDVTNRFCLADSTYPLSLISNLPRVVVDVADPVSLKLDVGEECCGCGCASSGASYPDQIPSAIAACFNGSFRAPLSGDKAVYITIGIFSIIRMERASQLLIPACDVCIPPSCCASPAPFTDPCSLFRSMDFPLKEFFPSAVQEEPRSCGCNDQVLDQKNYQ